LRYFFHIGYNGHRYHGWQKHSPHLTIQEVLEENISKVLKMPTTIIGCGRTDAQVHALQYFFHIEIPSDWDFDLAFRLNKILPEDISVYDIIKVENNAHAQFDATKRTYDYFIHTSKNPFLNQFSTYYSGKNLQIEKIEEAISLLTKYNDYKAFCKSPDKYENTICNVTEAEIFSNAEKDKFRIRISSNRFLRGMMRVIVAKLLEVGNVSLKVSEFEELLKAKQFTPNLEFADPQGLYLSNVLYPYLNLPAKTEQLAFFRSLKEEIWK